MQPHKQATMLVPPFIHTRMLNVSDKALNYIVQCKIRHNLLFRSLEMILQSNHKFLSDNLVIIKSENVKSIDKEIYLSRYPHKSLVILAVHGTTEKEGLVLKNMIFADAHLVVINLTMKYKNCSFLVVIW